MTDREAAGLAAPATSLLSVPVGFGAALGAPIGFCGGDGLVYDMAHHPTRTARHRRTRKDPPHTGNGQKVEVWLDDPGDPLTTQRDTPNPATAPSFTFPGKHPPAGLYEQGTEGFRFWTAVEALRRGADFWQDVLGGFAWRTGATLPVKLDAGVDLNAFYDREALNFFHDDTVLGRVFSGESPDVVCHEMGHAVLDAIKPELFDTAGTEAAAFHEAFADISAILSALQLDDMRARILQETDGHLYRNSRLSRLAEQLGAAIRLQNPQAVDRDCLRNAVNSFTYSDPLHLPHSAPASQLSSEPHSLSRVFTGAFLEALAGVLTHDAAGGTPSSAQLATVARRMAALLVEAIRQAPVVSNFFSQVAGGMVGKAEAGDRPILRAVFVTRSLLSLESAMQVASLEQGAGPARRAGVAAADLAEGALETVAIDARHYGIDQPLHVRSPGQPRRYEVRASAHDASSIEPASGLTAARSFTDDLVRRGRVDMKNSAAHPSLHRPGRFVTHRIEPADSGGLHLRRICFDCGLRAD